VSKKHKNGIARVIEKKQEHITNRHQRITIAYNKKPLKNTRNAHQGKFLKITKVQNKKVKATK
jgi:hypothetical protein